jgi:uncharacterized membrane protein
MMKRILAHLFSGPWKVNQYFPAHTMDRIEAAIAASEKKHNGELCFAVEHGLPLHLVVKGVTPRQRAENVFGELKVWDTDDNTGVLIYLLLSDRDIEIVVDRGLRKYAAQDTWETICRAMETAFKAGRFEDGVLEGIEKITAILAQHFPKREDDKNELADKPVRL